MSRAAQVLGLGLIVGSIGGLYWLWSSVSHLWPEMRDSRASVLSADRTHIVRYDEHGKKLWELAASALSIGEDMSIAEEITLHFFDSEGQEALTVRAPLAKLHNRTGDIELPGEIVVSGRDFSLSTENLLWSNEKKILTTSSAVRIESEEFILTGRGFEYSSETGRATILHDARLLLRKK
jgi:LPS export ABC transporter protein LptC